MICFGLIVTGEGERQFLPIFMAHLACTGMSRFEVISKIGQRTPVTSERRILRMVGQGKTIPNEDQKEIGIPARAYLRVSPNHCVILIDDLEQTSLGHVLQKFQRYRLAIDTLIAHEPELGCRAAVHFLANMLEAYYFADSQAIIRHLNIPNLIDFRGDVETIDHPKGELNRLCMKHLGRSFHEIDDGWAIIRQLNTERVLSRPNTCAWLRTLFAWCIEKMIQNHYGLELNSENINLLKEAEEDFYEFIEAFHLLDGCYASVSRSQLVYFGGNNNHD